MNNEEIKKRFIAFLHEEGITRQYIRNCQKIEPKTSFRTVSENVDDTIEGTFGKRNLIHVSFVWDKAPEKHDFWSCINDRWERIVDAIDNEQDENNIN